MKMIIQFLKAKPTPKSFLIMALAGIVLGKCFVMLLNKGF